MEIRQFLPQEIEKESFRIISKELEDAGKVLDPKNESVIKRCIHTTADFSYADTLVFSENAVDILKNLIRKGASMVTDTNMAKSGINKRELSKYGCEIECYMDDEDVRKTANEQSITRASASMIKAIERDRRTVFVVGNAPTALLTLHDHFMNNDYRPSFIVGVPVGFVNVEAAKELIMATDIPHIVNSGRKGGSNVAAAIINAVLYEMRDEA